MSYETFLSIIDTIDKYRPSVVETEFDLTYGYYAYPSMSYGYEYLRLTVTEEQLMLMSYSNEIYFFRR